MASEEWPYYEELEEADRPADYREPGEPPVCEGCNLRGPQGHQCEHNSCTCRICNPVREEASR